MLCSHSNVFKGVWLIMKGPLSISIDFTIRSLIDKPKLKLQDKLKQLWGPTGFQADNDCQFCKHSDDFYLFSDNK